MTKILFALLLMLHINASAQDAFKITDDAEGAGKIFNGHVTFQDLHNEPSFSWLDHGNEYRPDATVINKLGGLKSYKMVVFLGTWCDDSHILIPELEKVLRLAGYPLGQLTMYGVDRAKTTKDGAHKKYNITLVPTIILFDLTGKEAGRITESVKKSIEQDLYAIVENGQTPQPR